MVQGRFEPSAAEQLLELRRSRDRYAALADRLHDSADPDLDPTEMQARERDARRIAHAYEKSISNSVVRMSSMGKTHHFAMLSLGMRTWLMIFVAISGLEGGILLAHFQPQLFRLPRLPASAVKVERALDRAPIAAPVVAPRLATPLAATPPTATLQSVTPPTPPAQSAPAPIAPPVMAAAPSPRPATPAPTPSAPPPAKPATAPTPTPSARATSEPATPAPAPSVPIPSARPTSGPVITAAAPPAPVTEPPPAAPVAQPPPPVATTPAPSPPAPSPPVSPPAPAPAAAPVLTRPEAIAGTHTLPPYPGESKRMGESGSTLMRVAISIQGMATECTVVTSSGSARLDAAACHHVEARWRWKPATRDGQAVATTAAVTVVWNLQLAR